MVVDSLVKKQLGTDRGTRHEDHGSVSTADGERGHGNDVSDDGKADVDHDKGVYDVVALQFQCEKKHMIG